MGGNICFARAVRATAARALTLLPHPRVGRLPGHQHMLPLVIGGEGNIATLITLNPKITPTVAYRDSTNMLILIHCGLIPLR